MVNECGRCQSQLQCDHHSSMEMAYSNDRVQVVGFERPDYVGLLGADEERETFLYDETGTALMRSNGVKDSYNTVVKPDQSYTNLGNYSTAIPAPSDTSSLIREMEKHQPRDRCHAIYIVMLIHGIAMLIPWNMFINAKSYFEDYKLSQGNQSSDALIDYRTNFMSYVGMASQYPSFFINVLNVFIRCGGGGNLGIRVLFGIIVSVFIFIATVILAMLDSSTWTELFFWITMGSVVVLSAGTALYQNSLFGIVAILPMKYTNAIIFGNNVSGTVVAVLNIVMLVVAPDQKTAAVYYFVAAILILMIAFDAYFLTSHSRFYRYHKELHVLKQKEATEHLDHNSKDTSIMGIIRSFRRAFKQIWHLLFGVWFTFFITLLLFPTVMSDIAPMQINMSRGYWTSIFCFLLFNLVAALGNLATEFVKWPSAKWINVIIVSRVVFVPLLVLGNFRPDERSLPVFIQQDSVFLASAILFSFTSGYCSSLVMMYAPKCVPLKDAPTAGMMMAMFLCFGILSGINCSRIWSCVIFHC